jgi:hypothetical protein
VSYSEAYEEAKKTVTNGVSNSLPFDPLLLPPDNTADYAGCEATDSANGFCMDDCLMYESDDCVEVTVHFITHVSSSGLVMRLDAMLHITIELLHHIGILHNVNRHVQVSPITLNVTGSAVVRCCQCDPPNSNIVHLGGSSLRPFSM